MLIKAETIRGYLYRVATALSLVATTYGVADHKTWALIVSAVTTILGTSLASLNTSTKAKEPTDAVNTPG